MSDDTSNRFYAVGDDPSRPSSRTSILPQHRVSPAPRAPSPLRNERRLTTPTSSIPTRPIKTKPLARFHRMTQWWTKHAQDRWTGELLAGGLCIALLAAVGGILIGYDNEPAPSLPDGVTINALISVLSTLAKGSLLVVLAAALRQERWLYMSRRPKALSSVDTFEEASSGPWGSIVMLVTAKGSGRALLLAAVTVLCFGFEAFLQQLLALEARNIPVSDTGAASILTPIAYDASLARVGNNTGGSELVLAASIGAFGGASGAVPLPFCPSGNCTWPGYNSLAMCSVCEDITSQINIEGTAFSDITNFNDLIADYARNANSSTSSQRTFNATFRVPTGNSPTIDFPLAMRGADPVTWSVIRPRRYTWSLNIDPTPNSYWGGEWENETFAGVAGPLYAMGYLDMDLDSSRSRMVLNQALSCALTPCVRTQHTAMQSWVLEPNTTGTDYGHIEMAQNQPDGTVTSGWRASVNGTDFEVVDRGLNNIDGSANDFVKSLRIVLEGNSTYTRQGNFYGEGDDGNFDYESTAFTQTSGPWSSIGQQAIDGNGNFTDIVDQVARAVSGKMQALESTSVEGTVLRSEIIVRVRWAWLAFPLALVLTGLGGLVSTVLATRRRGLPIWKDSVLPLMLRQRATREERAQQMGRADLNDASVISKEAGMQQLHLLRLNESMGGEKGLWVFESPGQSKELQSLSSDEIGVAR